MNTEQDQAIQNRAKAMSLKAEIRSQLISTHFLYP